MPQYSKKYYLQRDLYEAFVETSISSGIFTNETLNWFYIYQVLKNQQ